MTNHTLGITLTDAVVKLLDLAKNLSWSNISNNCQFILSESKNNGESFFEQRKLRKAKNDSKTPKPLKDLMPTLLDIYPNIYDINLYIYKALKDLTIIEIQYYPKSLLDPVYRETVNNQEPMLHCKVAIPPYHSDGKEKFDINWEHNPPGHKWKMFWWQLKIKRSVDRNTI